MVPFFRSAKADSFRTTIVVCYPSVGTIKAIMELRRQGLWPIDSTVVVGVFYREEKTDYKQSMDLVQENGLDWFFFHPVEGRLDDADVFRKNACSETFAEIFRKSDGIVFFGGPDIPPSLYGRKTHLLSAIEDPGRHRFELSFIFHLLGGFQDKGFRPFLESDSGFPVLGICLGCQSLNVGTGGTLVQDIFAEKYGKMFLEDIVLLKPQAWHNNPWYSLHPDRDLTSKTLHPIRMLRTGRFCVGMGMDLRETPLVLSSHHQACDKLGKGFRNAALSEDGKVVEAIEHEHYPNVLGVQFHPEYRPLWDGKDQYRILLTDTFRRTFREMLEQNPPSVRFHRTLWSWFFDKVSHH